jgi:hypothetical protein
MTAILRYLGILNAAIWLGAAVFLMIGLPAVFSQHFKDAIAKVGLERAPNLVPVPGWAAQLIFARFFILQYVCCGVGLTHLVLECLYCGKPLLQRNLGVLAALTALALAGGLWLQPMLIHLNSVKYYGSNPDLQASADHSFKAWHGVSEIGNLLAIAGLLYYLWRITLSAEPPRYGSLNLDKIRS